MRPVQNIASSFTLNTDFYSDSALFRQSAEQIFARSWLYLNDAQCCSLPESVHPETLLPGFLDEPLLITRDADDQLRCMSNVCTHRGNLLVRHSGRCKNMVCGYHGRKFGLDGKMLFMPEFTQVNDFPHHRDDLHAIAMHNWRGLLFASLKPFVPFEEMMAPIEARIGWMPVEQFRFAPEYSQDYLVNAHWALYCDNYLEGFHIPYVHPELNKMLQYSAYASEIYPYSNLQLGIARSGEDAFDLPESSPDYGKKIAAYYYWLFPNTMLNFYPWGLSLNVVKPLQPNLTKVSFRTYLWKPEKFNAASASLLEKVEREDEDIVEHVQKGMRSRFYRQGRYSPTREQGVHHFHLLVDDWMHMP